MCCTTLNRLINKENKILKTFFFIELFEYSQIRLPIISLSHLRQKGQCNLQKNVELSEVSSGFEPLYEVLQTCA